jgi:hypothetical protein
MFSRWYALPMSFGRNPHVAKAQAAEQKAELATDHLARERAYREAAHLWERAASREQPGKRKAEYESNAERLRAIADGTEPADEDGAAPAERGVSAPAAPARERGVESPRFLN